MFSGIIEYVGTVAAVSPLGRGRSLRIEAGGLARGMRPWDSLAVNGACLTVIEEPGGTVAVEAVAETLGKTNLGDLGPGARVNLERPLEAGGRLHGHWVLGHVDSTARVLGVEKLPESVLVRFSLEDELRRWIVPRGSVALDGVSLTVARLDSRAFTVSLVGYTLAHTTFDRVETGRRVNVETDILGKYVAAFLERPGGESGGLSESKLREWGF
jgi:riboflavin synthase